MILYNQTRKGTKKKYEKRDSFKCFLYFRFLCSYKIPWNCDIIFFSKIRRKKWMKFAIL